MSNNADLQWHRTLGLYTVIVFLLLLLHPDISYLLHCYYFIFGPVGRAKTALLLRTRTFFFFFAGPCILLLLPLPLVHLLIDHEKTLKLQITHNIMKGKLKMCFYSSSFRSSSLVCVCTFIDVERLNLNLVAAPAQ